MPDPLPGAVHNPNALDKVEIIRCVHTLSVALKHHLRGERHWSECKDLDELVKELPNVRSVSQLSRAKRDRM